MAVESKTLLSGYFEKHSQSLSQKLLSAYSDFSTEPITWRFDGLLETLENSRAACLYLPGTGWFLIEAELFMSLLQSAAPITEIIIKPRRSSAKQQCL